MLQIFKFIVNFEFWLCGQQVIKGRKYTQPGSFCVWIISRVSFPYGGHWIFWAVYVNSLLHYFMNAERNERRWHWWEFFVRHVYSLTTHYIIYSACSLAYNIYPSAPEAKDGLRRDDIYVHYAFCICDPDFIFPLFKPFKRPNAHEFFSFKSALGHQQQLRHRIWSERRQSKLVLQFTNIMCSLVAAFRWKNHIIHTWRVMPYYIIRIMICKTSPLVMADALRPAFLLPSTVWVVYAINKINCSFEWLQILNLRI